MAFEGKVSAEIVLTKEQQHKLMRWQNMSEIKSQ
jgi:hypothetical protein